MSLEDIQSEWAFYISIVLTHGLPASVVCLYNDITLKRVKSCSSEDVLPILVLRNKSSMYSTYIQKSKSLSY
jgi:hypothetical protein